MDKKSEIMNEIADHRVAIAELKRKLNIYSQIPPIPEFGNTESVSYVGTNFEEISTTRYCDVATIIDIDFNMFHTPEYAHRAQLAAKMIAMQLHCKWYIDRDFVPDWDDGLQHKYTVYYSHGVNKFCTAQWNLHERPDVVFSTREKAQMCADWLQENWKDWNHD